LRSWIHPAAPRQRCNHGQTSTGNCHGKSHAAAFLSTSNSGSRTRSPRPAIKRVHPESLLQLHQWRREAPVAAPAMEPGPEPAHPGTPTGGRPIIGRPIFNTWSDGRPDTAAAWTKANTNVRRRREQILTRPLRDAQGKSWSAPCRCPAWQAAVVRLVRRPVDREPGAPPDLKRGQRWAGVFCRRSLRAPRARARKEAAHGGTEHFKFYSREMCLDTLFCVSTLLFRRGSDAQAETLPRTNWPAAGRTAWIETRS